MNCKNCKQELSETSDYCNKCGARVIRKRLNFRNLFEHISETFFNYDNKLLRTIVDLIKKPDEVIGGYFNGVRKRYINPISFFGLTITIVGLEWILLRKLFPDQLNLNSITIKGTENSANNFLEIIQEYSSLLMMFLVPVYAFIAKLTFFDKKKFNFVEHVVAFIYMMSIMSLFGIVTNFITLSFGLDMGITSYFSILIQVVYISYCYKKLYSIGNGEIIARALISSVLYIIIYIGLVVLFLVGYFVFEGKDALFELFQNFIPKK